MGFNEFRALTFTKDLEFFVVGCPFSGGTVYLAGEKRFRGCH